MRSYVVMLPYSPVTVGTSHKNLEHCCFRAEISILSCFTSACSHVGIFGLSGSYNAHVRSQILFQMCWSNSTMITVALIAVEHNNHNSVQL